MVDEAQNDENQASDEVAAVDTTDELTPAQKALKAQNEAEASGPVKTYNPDYSSPDDEDDGEYIGVSPEYRNAAEDINEAVAFEGVEGDNVEALAERTDGSEAVPGPVEHSDAPAKKTAASRR